ncbi:MAG: arginase family protein [Chitinophagaceae bacterium]|nr:arginase family protein [Chitinophagaceae bacterium]
MINESIYDFLIPVNFSLLNEDEDYRIGQIGYSLMQENDPETANLVLVGCNEYRGQGIKTTTGGADAIRRQFFKLYHWHNDIRIADMGNVMVGEKLQDSYAALQAVVEDLILSGKKVLVLGGSHDITLPIYRAFAQKRQLIEATVIDALVDLERDSRFAADNFLLEMLTSEPNYVKQFNLLGFQSYFTFPGLLEAIDKLRFDCVRVGRVQERMEDTEPIIRSSRLLSVDIKCLAHAYAPVNTFSPNGFTGQEVCKLMQFAGMSSELEVAFLAGFHQDDNHQLSSMQMAHLCWYFMDGIHKMLHEASLEDRTGFNEYHTLCAEVDTLFLQSRHTGRWWMQMPDKSFAPCSYNDYLMASHNDLPERWLRLQERN